MPTDAVAWLEALFSDLNLRAPHGIVLTVDRAELPLQLRVELADGPVAELVLRDDGPLALIAVAEQVQRHVDAGWEVALPPCPDHGTGLRLARAGTEVRWRCPHGDVDCAIGDYDALLWPPRPTDERRAASLLGMRLDRRGSKGMKSWSVSNGVVHATVREGTDESALRAATAPLAVELEWAPLAGWSRRDGLEGETLTITNARTHLARLAGPLHRSLPDGLRVGDVPAVVVRPSHWAPGRTAAARRSGGPVRPRGGRGGLRRRVHTEPGAGRARDLHRWPDHPDRRFRGGDRDPL